MVYSVSHYLIFCSILKILICLPIFNVFILSFYIIYCSVCHYLMFLFFHVSHKLTVCQYLMFMFYLEQIILDVNIFSSVLRYCVKQYLCSIYLHLEFCCLYNIIMCASVRVRSDKYRTGIIIIVPVCTALVKIEKYR